MLPMLLLSFVKFQAECVGSIETLVAFMFLKEGEKNDESGILFFPQDRTQSVLSFSRRDKAAST